MFDLETTFMEVLLSNEQNRRLFFGFSIDQDLAKTLCELQCAMSNQGVLVDPINFHMTLLFLGSLSNTDYHKLVGEVDARCKRESQHFSQFEQNLDLVSYWHKPKIISLASFQACDKLNAFYQYFVQFIQPLELKISSPIRAAISPHITLLRKAKPLDISYSGNSFPLLAIQSLTAIELSRNQLLKPTQLHLYQSTNDGSGVRYRIINSWPLI